MAQEQEKNPSSSFSEFQLITILAGIMALVPEQFQKPSIEKTVAQGLKSKDYSEDYIRTAVAYTIAKSNGGTWQKFKAYLGKCIDLGWADGWEPEPDLVQVDDEKKKEAFLESRRNMTDDILKADAENGCQASIQVLSERGVKYQRIE